MSEGFPPPVGANSHRRVLGETNPCLPVRAPGSEPEGEPPSTSFRSQGESEHQQGGADHYCRVAFTQPVEQVRHSIKPLSARREPRRLVGRTVVGRADEGAKNQPPPAFGWSATGWLHRRAMPYPSLTGCHETNTCSLARAKSVCKPQTRDCTVALPRSRVAAMLRTMASPTRAKRHLGRFLLRLRIAAGMTAAQVAAVLKTTDSTVSRYEKGEVLPVWSTVLNLVNLYKGDEAAHSEASRLFEIARDEPKAARLPGGTPKEFRGLIRAEIDGYRERTVEPIVAPGLVQVPEYTEALFAVGHRFHDPDSTPDDGISVRRRRQNRLTGDDPLELHAILDETVVRRCVGGPDVMTKQLTHILDLIEQPNVTIQVVKHDAGAYGLSNGGCIIVDFPQDEYEDASSGVYLEYPAGGKWIEEPTDVQRFTAMFEDAVRVALTPVDTAKFLQERLGALKKQ
jgi:transcriptional regulator with XRE-family HTH domain